MRTELRELMEIVGKQLEGYNMLPDDMKKTLKDGGVFPLEQRHLDALAVAVQIAEELEPSGAVDWMRIAEGEIGVKEIAGPGFHPRILEYFAATTFTASSDETPWCSAFVNWVLMKAGYFRTKSAAACSWLFTGNTLVEPKYGCLVVMRRGARPAEDYANLKPNQSSYPPGHVGFYVGGLGGHILVLGGNQNNSVCTDDYDPSLVLRYLWPFKE